MRSPSLESRAFVIFEPCPFFLSFNHLSTIAFTGTDRSAVLADIRRGDDQPRDLLRSEPRRSPYAWPSSGLKKGITLGLNGLRYLRGLNRSRSENTRGGESVADRATSGRADLEMSLG